MPAVILPCYRHTGISPNPTQIQTVNTLTAVHIEDSKHSDSKHSDTVHIEDMGSRPRKVTVTSTVQGIPARGVIDSDADITIINADLFKNIEATAKLRKKAIKQPDKVPLPYTYDQKPFQLDGHIDLDISSDGCTMCTPVYAKMDAKDQLLLSEGVCSQLHILTYYPAVSDAQPDFHV